MTARLAVPAVGYLPHGEETYRRNEVDSTVWIVFVYYKRDRKVSSIWLTQDAARKAAQKFKQRQTQIISVLVPGLIYTAAAKLRRAERT